MTDITCHPFGPLFSHNLVSILGHYDLTFSDDLVTPWLNDAAESSSLVKKLKWRTNSTEQIAQANKFYFL